MRHISKYYWHAETFLIYLPRNSSKKEELIFPVWKHRVRLVISFFFKAVLCIYHSCMYNRLYLCLFPGVFPRIYTSNFYYNLLVFFWRFKSYIKSVNCFILHHLHLQRVSQDFYYKLFECFHSILKFGFSFYYVTNIY